MNAADAHAWPTELRLHKDRRTLTITFADGEHFDLPAEYLRVKSPSAEVQGHSAEERKTVPGKRDVGIIEVLPVGNYAVRLVFDDLHSTGIFGWSICSISAAGMSAIGGIISTSWRRRTCRAIRRRAAMRIITENGARRRRRNACGSAAAAIKVIAAIATVLLKCLAPRPATPHGGTVQTIDPK